jgi:acyl dehydratase
MGNNLDIADVCVGEALPSFRVPITVTSVMATALATRDYQPVHHDLEKVKSLGNETVFTNTHTTAAYLEKLVMRWAGPNAFLKSLKLRLGVPNYAGDEMLLQGNVTAIDPVARRVTVEAVGSNSRGDHVTAELVIELQGMTNV